MIYYFNHSFKLINPNTILLRTGEEFFRSSVKVRLVFDRKTWKIENIKGNSSNLIMLPSFLMKKNIHKQTEVYG